LAFEWHAPDSGPAEVVAAQGFRDDGGADAYSLKVSLVFSPTSMAVPMASSAAFLAFVGVFLCLRTVSEEVPQRVSAWRARSNAAIAAVTITRLSRATDAA
jgi:hypothetical protein